MLRRLSLLATLALLLSLAAAAPAHADFIDTLNGHNLDIFTKGQSTPSAGDDDGNCYIAVAADLHRRFDTPDDEAALAVRGAGRVSRGDCAVRVQVDKLRVGSEGGTHVVDDCRISLAGLTPCAPRNSGPRESAYGEGDFLTEFGPGLGTDSLRCSYAVRVFVSVRWFGGQLEHFSLRSFYERSSVFHCVDDVT